MHHVPKRNYTAVDMARAFMMAAHEAVNQKRKYTGEPYYRHPEEVLDILLTYANPTVEQQCAALLHDTVEDTEVTIDTINRIFGPVVTNLVSGLTDVSTIADGNREQRKAIDRTHTINTSYATRTVKLADLISNTRSIVERDPNFARTYIPEKLKLLWAFKHDMANDKIWQVAFDLCADAITELWGIYDDQFDVWNKAGFFKDITVNEYIEARERVGK